MQVPAGKTVGATFTKVPLCTDGTQTGTGPAWGYHGYEYWLTLGNLLQDITGRLHQEQVGSFCCEAGVWSHIS